MRFNQKLSVSQTLIVVAGASVLFWIFLGMIPAVYARARPSARAVSCQSNLKQIGKAIEMYAEVPANNRPPPDLNLLYPKYIADPKVFRCPYPEIIDHGGSYGIVQNPQINTPMKLILCYDAKSHAGQGRNVLFTDLTVDYMNEKEFQDKLQDQLRTTVVNPNSSK